MEVTPVQTQSSTIAPLNSAASCTAENLWQGIKAYLSQLKDLFKTSYVTLGNVVAPGIIYEGRTVPPAQFPVP